VGNLGFVNLWLNVGRKGSVFASIIEGVCASIDSRSHFPENTPTVQASYCAMINEELIFNETWSVLLGGATVITAETDVIHSALMCNAV